MDLSTSIDSLPVSEKALDDSTRAIGIMTASVIPEAAKVESTLQALPAPENMPKGPLQQAEEHLLGSLHECAKAVSVLSTALERAITKLSASEGHTPACLQTDFHNLQAAFNRMTWQESALRMHQDAQSTVASISGSANEGIAANTKSLQNTGLPAGSIVLEQAPTSAHSAARAPTAITSETRRTKLVPDREMDRVSSNTYYPHGDRQPLPIPTEDEEEYFDWGPTETEKPRKREAKACLRCEQKKIYCEPSRFGCVQCDKAGYICYRQVFTMTWVILEIVTNGKTVLRTNSITTSHLSLTSRCASEVYPRPAWLMTLPHLRLELPR